MAGSRIFTEEETEFIKEHYRGTHMQDLLNMLNGRFGKSYRLTQLTHYCYRHGYRNGIDTRLDGSQGVNTRFKTGVPSKYKGVHLRDRKGYTEQSLERMRPTQFKKGGLPHNTHAIGDIVRDGEGYLAKKVSDTRPRWKHLHRLIWEEAHGEIPKGMCVIFLDGNKENVKLENLALVDTAVNSKRTRYGAPANTEIGRTIIALSELDIAIDRRSGRSPKRRRGKGYGQD